MLCEEALDGLGIFRRFTTMSFDSMVKGSSSPVVAPIVTARLELVAILPEAVLSEQANDGRLGEILGCRVTAEWPPEGLGAACAGLAAGAARGEFGKCAVVSLHRAA